MSEEIKEDPKGTFEEEREIEAKNTAEAPVQEDSEEVVTKGSIRDVMSRIEGAPSSAQIDAWKEEHGDVFVFLLSEDEIFLFRSITRTEFSNIQMQMKEHAQATGSAPPDSVLEDMIVSQTALWQSPRAALALDKKGGTASALQEQIMLNSYFLSAQISNQLVVKL